MTTTFEERAAELLELSSAAAVCVACPLHESRTQVVFASGTVEADVMFVGEGPGQREDEQGLPFVGRSGQLLEQLLGEIGFTRNEVYIANVVKCRPPGNRDPRPDEVEACKGYLRRQIMLVDPRVVVTMGNFASKLLLRTETGITRLRGHGVPWWGRHIVPTFHPAAALYTPAMLKTLEADFARIPGLLDAPTSEYVGPAVEAPLEALHDEGSVPAGVGATPQQTSSPPDEQLDLF